MTGRYTLHTKVGKAEPTENQFRGFAVGADLAGRASNWSALSLAVGHPGLCEERSALLDDLVVCSLAADPHIWPLKVARLLSSYGHVLPGVAAGILCTDGGFVGWAPYAAAATVLSSFADADDFDGALEESLQRSQRLPGFGVAFREQDERVVAFRRCVAQRGLDQERYWQTFERLDDRLRRRGAPANIGSASAAALLDAGFTPSQIGVFGVLLLFPNYVANAVEGADQAPRLLRTLPAEAIEDRTPPARMSPRAQPKRR